VLGDGLVVVAPPVVGLAPPVEGGAAPPWAVPELDGVVVVVAGVVVAAGVVVVVDVVVDGVVVVLVTCGVFASPGTVSVGAELGSGWDAFVLPPPPQAASKGSSPVRTAAVATFFGTTAQSSTAGSRRPQVGQFGTSLGASCSSEQPHRRRFSTDHGRLLSLGASGRSFPTTVNSSPVSRST
jgi:hypothetical protein